MKWMRRKRLESDWMDERDRELKALLPCVYLPFLKGTSVDERKNENILDRVTLVVLSNDNPPVSNVSSLGRSIHYSLSIRIYLIE